jgi:hypothetical protein
VRLDLVTLAASDTTVRILDCATKIARHPRSRDRESRDVIIALNGVSAGSSDYVNYH